MEKWLAQNNTSRSTKPISTDIRLSIRAFISARQIGSELRLEAGLLVTAQIGIRDGRDVRRLDLHRERGARTAANTAGTNSAWRHVRTD